MKRRLYEIISPARPGDKVSMVFDWSIVALIVLSIASICLESYKALADRFATAFNAFDVFSVAVFTFEYISRLWTADYQYTESKHPHIRYAFSLMAMIDLLSILPFYIPFLPLDLRFLRLFRLLRLSKSLRLLRVFKIGRYSDSVQVIGRVIKKQAPQLLTALGMCAMLLLFSAILMYNVENAAQPDAFPDVGVALWWSVCTLTTVGYGDIYPVTGLGRFLAAVISLIGIGVIAIPTGIISAGFMSIVDKHPEEPDNAETVKDEISYCPYCGKSLK